MNLQGAGFLVITSLLWGANWPVMKFLLSEVPPFSARTMSCAVGLALMLGVAAARREKLMPPKGQWRRLLISAGLNFGAWMSFTAVGLASLRASETAILAYTLPIWTVLLARPLLGERLTAARSLGLLLGLSGVCLLVFSEPPAVAWTKLPGVAFTLMGAMSFALGVVLSKRAPLNMPPFAAVCWQTGLGMLPLVAGMLVERPDFAAVDAHGGLAFVSSGALANGLGYITWFAALRRLPASLVGIGSLLVPAVGVVASAAMLGEPLGWREAGALALTLSGVAIASRR
jgi:drug/metabolite transporter (DMT)-like permease